MSVTLLRAYQSFASGAVVTLADDVEVALITQGLATASIVTAMSRIPPGGMQSVTVGGNVELLPQGNQGLVTPTYLQGNSILPNIALGSLALTSYETNGVAPGVAGTTYYTEIYVPYVNTWKGIGLLNGTTVGTDNHLVALYGTSGALLANSAVAGVVTSGASAMQNIPFVTAITLPPGRYFLAYQSNGTTDTIRHILSANGSFNINGSFTGTFGTVLGQIATVSTTFTTAIAPIAQLYTV